MSRGKVILRTGRLHVLEMADIALRDAGIPHYMREERSSGVELAMPALPSAGPGTWWIILVPPSSEKDALSLIQELPFETEANPSVWDCRPTPRAKRLLQIGIWISLGLIAASLISSVIAILTKAT